LVFRDLAETLEQPRPRQGPVALHGGSGNAESVSRFVNRQAAEVTQLDDPALLGVQRRQFVERSIECEQV
jgi:hypothetical protein